jgi:pilus assembly protein CpaC
MTIVTAAGLTVDRAEAQANFPRYVKLGDDASSHNRLIRLGINKSMVVELPRDAGDVLVSNPDVADAVLRTSRRLYLIGVQIGQASVFLFDGAGQEIASLDIMVEGDLSGLQRILNAAVPLGTVQVEAINGSIVLTGNVPSSLDSNKAEDVANSALEKDRTISGRFVTRGSVINLLTVSGSDQVTLKVTIAEIRREVVRQLGINSSALLSASSIGFSLFNPSVTPANFVNLASSSASASFNSGGDTLSATLKALEETNMMRLLAEPNLTAVSGERASFLAGGKYPAIRTVTAGSTGDTVIDADTGNITQESATGDAVDLEFLNVGVSLDFLPIVLSGGRISLKVKTEVSEFTMDGSARLTGGFGDSYTLPPITTRRAETTVELPSGGSFMIGGLVQETTRRSISGMPGLQRLPILGALFSSRDFQRFETELVIIVTPYLVRPVALSKLATPIDNLAVSNDAQGIFMGRLTQTYGGADSRAPVSKYHGQIGFAFE